MKTTLLERKQAAAAKARAAKVGRKPRRKAARAVEPINPTMAYGFDLCGQMFGIGRGTLRRFVDGGMPYGGAGSQKFVLGKDLIDAMVKDGSKGG